MRRQVLVIGMDGATWDLLDPWISDGVLPTLGRLVRAGSAGPLRSTLPPVTCPAWPSFMTGKEPAGHGVFDFLVPERPPGKTRVIDSTHIRSRLFWEYLSDAGVTVGVLNVPATHPPRPVRGWVVPGLLAPERGHVSHPSGLLAPYAGELGPYRVAPRILYEPGKERELCADLRELTAVRIRYAVRLARDRPVDFLMVHFQATDVAQHKLWRHLDPTHPWHAPETAGVGREVRALFEQIDAGLAELMETVPDATVFVLSDHGFGPQTRTVNLNLHFEAQGLLAFLPGAGLALRRRAAASEWTTRIAQLLWRREHLLGWEDVDWARTRAWSFGHLGQLWLGAAEQERDAAKREVAAALSELRDPATDAPLVDRLVWREEAPGGPHAHLGPDAHVVMDGYRAPAYPLLAADGAVLTEQRRGDSGSHRPDGILIAAGAGIRSRAAIEGARLIDLAPTILHLMGVPVPDDMDGTVLAELLERPDDVAYQPAVPHLGTDPAVSDVMHGGIAERLRALGYLEGPGGGR